MASEAPSQGNLRGDIIQPQPLDITVTAAMVKRVTKKRPAASPTSSKADTSSIAKSIASEVESMTPTEQRLGFQRMKRALAKHPDATQKWQDIQSLPSRGHNKNQKKQAFLWSFIQGESKDSEVFGPSFWSSVKETLDQEEDSNLGQWISRGRLEQLVGYAEASERIEADEMSTKEDSNGRPLYFYTEQHHDTKAVKRVKTGFSSQKGISGEQASQAHTNFEEMEVTAEAQPMKTAKKDVGTSTSLKKRPAGPPTQQSILTKISKMQTKGLFLEEQMKKSIGKKYLSQQLSDLAKLMKEADVIKKALVSVKSKKKKDPEMAIQWVQKMDEVIKSSRPILKSYEKSKGDEDEEV